MDLVMHPVGQRFRFLRWLTFSTIMLRLFAGHYRIETPRPSYSV